MTALTVKEAIQSPSPAYGFINQDSPSKAQALLSVQITGLVKAFNVGKSMEANQIAECVKMILEDNNFRCLKPDDFKVCFTKMIKGHYGKSYDRMDAQVIFEALENYLQERLDTVEQISIDRHKLEMAGKMAQTNPEGQKKIGDIFRAVLKEVSPQVKYKAEKVVLKDNKYEIEVVPEKDFKEPVKETKVIQVEKSERDIFIQSCFREFSETIKKKGSLLKSGDFIEYEGKHLSETEYVQARITKYDIEQLEKNKE